MERIEYLNDLSTASIRSPLAAATNYSASTCNSSYGWWPVNTSSSTLVSRVDFNNDTAIAQFRGIMENKFHGGAGVNHNAIN